MVHDLHELRFDLLNANDMGITFSVLDDEAVSDFQVSDAEWRYKTVGLVAKASIKAWHLIGMQQKDWKGALLLGEHKDTGESWCTSEVLFVAPDHSAVLTRSGSLYRLEAQASGEPALHLVLHLVYTLRRWGAGALVRDWPEIFY